MESHVLRPLGYYQVDLPNNVNINHDAEMHNFRSETPRGMLEAPLPQATKGIDHRAVNQSWPHLIAGAFGGTATTLLTAPLDVLRTRLQSDLYRSQPDSSHALSAPSSHGSYPSRCTFTSQIRGTLYTLSSIQRLEGWPGLFRGLGPNLTGIVPATAIKFYTYGNCKRLLSETQSFGKETALVHILAAATAGVVTGTLTNPIWLVKTRLQLDRLRMEKGGCIATQRYKNSFDCVTQVLRQEGFRGMFRGLSASYLGAAETTLHLVMYEQLKNSLARREDRASSGAGSWARTVGWLGVSGAAGASKLLAGLIAYPHEVVRTRLRQLPMENGQQKYTGLIQCFRLILKEEGFRSMYGGLTPHLLRAVPAAAISLGVYEFVLKRCNTEA